MASEVIELKANQEFRFLVGTLGNGPVKIQLRQGLAEVYGNEMMANKIYTFPINSKGAVFTYHGAEIEVKGSPIKKHVGQKCDYMRDYLKVHGILEEMRTKAYELSEQFNFDGDEKSNPPDVTKTPICLVCRPARSMGKSTLCRILLNYATRRHRAPIFVDLDPDLGHIGLPGSIGALSIQSPIDIETGMCMDGSVLMHFGHTNATTDNEVQTHLYFQTVVQNLANIVHTKLKRDRKSYYSGVIINTSPYVDEDDYKRLFQACLDFRANVVLVMDDEILRDDLRRDLTNCKLSYPVEVFDVPKMVHISSQKPESDRIEYRFAKIREYFYGLRQEFTPVRSDVKFGFIKRLIYKIGTQLMLQDSLMPLGTKPQDSQSVRVSHYDCKPSDLLHHLLAISFAKINDVVENPETVLRTNIMGFICVIKVKDDIVTILTPERLPKSLDYVLLYSNIQYMDELI